MVKKSKITLALWKIDLGEWGGLAILLLKIVINNPVLPVFMVVNNCKKIKDWESFQKFILANEGAGEIIA